MINQVQPDPFVEAARSDVQKIMGGQLKNKLFRQEEEEFLWGANLA